MLALLTFFLLAGLSAAADNAPPHPPTPPPPLPRPPWTLRQDPLPVPAPAAVFDGCSIPMAGDGSCIVPAIRKYVPQYFAFLHIAKTGGTSLMHDMAARGHDLRINPLNNNEVCYNKSYAPAQFNMILLRSPRGHVVSQFLHCKHTKWGKNSIVDTAFPRNGTDEEGFALWVAHFHNDTWRPWNPNAVPGATGT